MEVGGHKVEASKAEILHASSSFPHGLSFAIKQLYYHHRDNYEKNRSETVDERTNSIRVTQPGQQSLLFKADTVTRNRQTFAVHKPRPP